MIRAATDADLEALLDLTEMKRSQYVAYNPRFHRASASAREVQRPFLASQIGREGNIALVDDDGSAINGFIIAATGPAPPVYDIGGLSTGVDDFMVRDPSLRETVGRALLEEVRVRVHEQGSVQLIVVCGPKDTPKRDMLQADDLAVASEWFSGPV